MRVYASVKKWVTSTLFIVVPVAAAVHSSAYQGDELKLWVHLPRRTSRTQYRELA